LLCFRFFVPPAVALGMPMFFSPSKKKLLFPNRTFVEPSLPTPKLYLGPLLFPFLTSPHPTPPPLTPPSSSSHPYPFPLLFLFVSPLHLITSLPFPLRFVSLPPFSPPLSFSPLPPPSSLCPPPHPTSLPPPLSLSSTSSFLPLSVFTKSLISSVGPHCTVNLLSGCPFETYPRFLIPISLYPVFWSSFPTPPLVAFFLPSICRSHNLFA